MARFRFRFLKNGSGGSDSGSWKNGVSSCAILIISGAMVFLLLQQQDAPKYLITTNHTEKAYSVDFEFADLYEALLHVCVPPCAANTCAVWSRFCRGGRAAGGSRSKNLLEVAMKQMLARGHNLTLPDEAREPGASSTYDQKTQDSWHKSDQPRGFFP